MEIVAGFSNETIFHMLGGRFRSTFRPLNDAIIKALRRRDEASAELAMRSHLEASLVRLVDVIGSARNPGGKL